MGLFDIFGYTNFHELNLDWLIVQCRKLEEKVNELEGRIDGLKEEILQEVNEKLQEFEQELLAKVQEQLDVLKQELTTLINTSITNLETKINEQLTAINLRIDELSNKLEECCNEAKEQIAGIKTQIDNIEDRLSTIDTHLTNIDNEINTINSRLDAVEADISDINTNITSILNTLENVNDSIGQINTKITTIQNNITSINSTIDTMQSEISTLNTKVSTAETNITVLNTKVNNHETRITALEKGSGGASSDALFRATASTTAELQTARTNARKSNYAGIEITLTASNIMAKNYWMIDDFCKNDDNIQMVQLKIIGFRDEYVSGNNLTNYLNAWAQAQISGSVFERLIIDVGSYESFKGCDFQNCKIIIKQQHQVIFESCSFGNCYIEITTQLAYDMEALFEGCYFYNSSTKCSSTKPTMIFNNCVIDAGQERYNAGTYYSAWTNCYIIQSTLKYSVFDNCRVHASGMLQECIIQNGTQMSLNLFRVLPIVQTNSNVIITQYVNP